MPQSHGGFRPAAPRAVLSREFRDALGASGLTDAQLGRALNQLRSTVAKRMVKGYRFPLTLQTREHLVELSYRISFTGPLYREVSE